MERTGNRIADPDSVWNEDGSRKMEPDGFGGQRPATPVLAPSSESNIQEEGFLGKRTKKTRRYGAQFYDDAPAEQAAPPAPPADPEAERAAEQKVVTEITGRARLAREGDGQALAWLQELAAAEYATDPGRKLVRLALSRSGIKRPAPAPVGTGAPDDDEEAED